MQWWNEFVDWFTSDDGWRVISSAIIPFLAIVIAGLVAALVGRTAIRRLLTVNDRELRAAAVTAMISSARRAAVWNTLSVSEQRHAEHAALEADIRLRLLPVTGVALACDWCAHEIAMMKKNAVSFSFQAEQSLMEFRSRLIDWHTRPSRAKKLFKNDLDTWAYETSLADQDLVTQQQAWAAQQAATSAEATAVRQPAAEAPARVEAVSRPVEPSDDSAAVRPASPATSVPFAQASPVQTAPEAATTLAPTAAMPIVPAAAPTAAAAPLSSPAVTPSFSPAVPAVAPAPAAEQFAPRFPPAMPVVRQPAPQVEPGEVSTGETPVVAENFPPVTANRVRERIAPAAGQDDELG